MGQKANLLTIRNKPHIHLLKIQSPKFFLFSYKIINFLEIFFLLKGIILTKTTQTFFSSILEINFYLYFKASKLLIFSKKKINNLLLNNLKFKKRHQFFFLKKLILTHFNFLKLNLTKLKIKILNFNINKNLNHFLFLKLKNFKNILFNRRFNLFIDLIKISNLLIVGKISTTVFLKFLSEVFKILPKTKHGQFIFFIKFLLKTLSMDNFTTKQLKELPNSTIGGIKIQIKGKLLGKTRSSNSFVQTGSVSTQTISKNIEFSKINIFTKYGVFGFKLWLYRLY